jgi:hypothetical protein
MMMPAMAGHLDEPPLAMCLRDDSVEEDGDSLAVGLGHALVPARG